MNEAYLKYIKIPNVEISISGYRPIRVFVNGESKSSLQTMQGSLSLFRDKGRNLAIFENSNNENSAITNNLGGSDFYFPTVFDAIRVSGGITKYSS